VRQPCPSTLTDHARNSIFPDATLHARGAATDAQNPRDSLGRAVSGRLDGSQFHQASRREPRIGARTGQLMAVNAATACCV
jgi:hypothetical protein